MSNNIKKSLVMLSAVLICVAGSAFAQPQQRLTPQQKSMMKTHPTAVQKGQMANLHHPNAQHNIQANSGAINSAKQNHAADIQRAKNNPKGAMAAKNSPKGQEAIRKLQLNNDVRTGPH
jgi:hypothetical protein